QVFGSGDYSMRVWLDPQKLAARNLTAGDVVAAIREQNVQVAAGQLGAPPSPGTQFQIALNAAGRLTDEQQFRDIIVKTGDDGQVVRLRDIARVVLVVILFLQTWRASLIPLFAVPVSVIGTFAVLLAFGFSINTLSLFGLVLAIGIVVDDAIVVVENVERHIAEGLSPLEATKAAMSEVSRPIIAITLVLVAVFGPVAFVSGLTGEFYRQFA